MLFSNFTGDLLSLVRTIRSGQLCFHFINEMQIGLKEPLPKVE